MSNLQLINAEVVSFDNLTEKSAILIDGEKIAELSAEKSAAAEKIVDLSGLMVYPGFIDVHNHGAFGVDVNSADADDLRRVSQFLATEGVTAWLPTFVPDSDETYQKVIAAIGEVMRTQDSGEAEPAAQIVGVHYEGVFANEQMCGALRPEFFRKFTGGDELEKLPALENAVHLTTYAPEVEGGIELTEELTRRGWIPSIGHTKADVATLDRALAAGAKHVTHLFNAMTGVHHRDIGVAGWALTRDQISCEIIADGIHVHPEMLKFAANNKPADKLILVSDSVAPTGLGDGTYELWNEKIAVVGGKTQNERGSIAGSVITMLDAVRRMKSLGFSAAHVARMASFNAAKMLGIEKQHGSIEVGKRADLTALDENGEVKFVMIGGRVAVDKLS